MAGIASSLDVINTTFASHKGPLILDWVRNCRFLRVMQAKSKIKVDGGTYIERTIDGGPAAQGIAIRSGTERRPRNYANTTHKLRVEPHRLSCILEIPKKAIRHNMGAPQVIDLLKDKPRGILMGHSQDLNKFLLTGISPGLVFATEAFDGFVTLNGQYTGGIHGVGAGEGALDFLAPAAQTDNVFDLAKSTAYYHYNQYANITTWAGNGLRTLKKAYWLAADFDETQDDAEKGADLIVMDPDVFANYTEQASARVMTTSDQQKTSSPTKGNMYPFENGMAFCDYGLDRTLFAGAAANGVTYMVNTKHWEFIWFDEPELSDFEKSGPEFDTVYAEFTAHGNAICTKLVSQAAVSGGAV
jgi:hypothetical protein